MDTMKVNKEYNDSSSNWFIADGSENLAWEKVLFFSQGSIIFSELIKLSYFCLSLEFNKTYKHSIMPTKKTVSDRISVVFFLKNITY